MLTKEKALAKVQYICSKQEKCKSEIRQKLYDWKVNVSDHEWILQSLVNDKFIDESRYVGYFVRDKFKLNKWGKIKIEYALRAKQIAPQLINESLGQIDDESYYETCNDLIVKKLKTLKEEENYKIKEKLVRFGQSRGFEASLVYKIVESII